MPPFRTVLTPLPWAIAITDWGGRVNERTRWTADLDNDAPTERAADTGRTQNGRKSIAIWLTAALLAISHDTVAVAEKPAKESGAPGLRVELRGNGDRSILSRPLSREALRAFLYQGRPYSVGVTEKNIAVDYRVSGVLFDRVNGEAVQRFTAIDGWPKNRGPEFAAPNYQNREPRFFGPGIIDVYRGPFDKGESFETVAEVQFQGSTWRAVQRNQFRAIVNKLREAEESKGVKGARFISWTTVLEQYSTGCHIEVGDDRQSRTQRYTAADGLASNIVTHLAVCQGTLWAACADIYDPAKNDWGPGGLCRFEPKSGRWQRIDTIDGRPVRWITLLQVIDDELWVGFREGEGLLSDDIGWGKGLYVPWYGPHVKDIVLARLSGDKWTTYLRAIRVNAVPLTEKVLRMSWPWAGSGIVLLRSWILTMLAIRQYVRIRGSRSARTVVRGSTLVAFALFGSLGYAGLFLLPTGSFLQPGLVIGSVWFIYLVVRFLRDALRFIRQRSSEVRMPLLIHAGFLIIVVVVIVHAQATKTGRHGSEIAEPLIEYPLAVARSGNQAIVFLGNESGRDGSGPHTGNLITMLDLDDRSWRNYEQSTDFNGGEPLSLTAAKGEIVVLSDRGAHRFHADSKSWRWLDPRSELQAQDFNAVALVGDELWVGYGGFGRQGISRYSEKTGQWTYWGPKELGTACPVSKIVTTRNGDAWVLFGDCVNIRQFGEIRVHGSQDGVTCRCGLGCLPAGKWQFPAEGPTAIRDEASDPFDQWDGPEQMESLGDQLVCKTRTALYLGPAPWKRILEFDEHWASSICSARDGKGIIIRGAGPRKASGSEWEYAVYDGTRSELQFKNAEIDDRRTTSRELEALDPIYDRRYVTYDWVQIPGSDINRPWLAGPFAGEDLDRRVLVGPHAFWIHSRGEIVRVDRKALNNVVDRAKEGE